METKEFFVPNCVMVDAYHEVAVEKRDIKPVFIFVRADGWSLGSPRELVVDARRLYHGRWAEEWQLSPNNIWEKVFPPPEDVAVTITTAPAVTYAFDRATEFIEAELEQRRLAFAEDHEYVASGVRALVAIDKARRELGTLFQHPTKDEGSICGYTGE